jgi:VWFA-related protein
MKRSAFPLVLFLVAAFPFLVCAQTDRQQPEYVYKSQTRIVVFDIVATDAKGKIVSDLKPDEVQIFEDKKEQRKGNFSFHEPDKAGVHPDVDFHLPPDVFTNEPQYKGNSSFNIILFDALNTSFSGLAYAHDELIRYLDKNPPAEPTAIFALGDKLWMLHDFTTDYPALKEVMRKFKGRGTQLVVNSPDSAKTYKREATFSIIPVNHQAVTMDALRSLSRIMAAYPGRKNLIWLSEGFPMGVNPESIAGKGPLMLSDNLREIEATADAMMEAQIAIYPIDVAGLRGDAFGPMLSRFQVHSVMKQMAEKTGGKVFLNNNDVDHGIRSSIDDGSSYYTTSYYPENRKWDGKFRRIELKTTRPGIKLRYRQGYYATDMAVATAAPSKVALQQASIEFAQALDPNLPVSTGVLFKAQVTPPAENKKLTVNFALDPRQVRFTAANDGLEHAEVSCIAWAFPVKGKPVGSRGGTVKVAVDDATYKKIMASALPCKQSLELDPGNYMLRLGVIDQTTQRIGALTAWVTVPGNEPEAESKTETETQPVKSPQMP